MKLSRQKREELLSAALTQTLGLILTGSIALTLTALGSQPAWWGTRGAVHAPQVVTNSGVVTTNYIPNDYVMVTQGQLKQFLARGADEMNAHLAGGAGTNINGMVINWTSDYATNGYSATHIKPSDYTAMNVGQLKYVGNKVWSRLVAAGYTNAVPSWLAPNTNTDGMAANLGQLKTVFNFQLSTATDSDGNGLPDAWEIQYFGHTGNDPNSSPDGNGLTLLQDYQQGNDPTNYYSQGGTTITPTITVFSGNLQSGIPGSITALPLVVLVANSTGAVLANAPVTFTVSSGGGLVSATSGGTTTSTWLARTDANGHAQVYYQSANSASSTINATTGGQSVTFTELSGSVTTPVFSPPAGTYPSTQIVTLTAANQQPINVALAVNGATAVASSTQAIGFPASSVINGDRLGTNWSGGGGWMDGTGDTYPDWLEVDFEGSQPISQIDLFTLQDLFQNPSDPTLDMIFSHYGVTDFEMQYWNGSAWTDVPNGQIAGNNHVWNQFNFSPITTAKIRVLISGADGDYSRLTELEAWVRPSPASTIYYTTDGTTPTSSSASVTSGGTVSVATSETIQAFTVAAGYSDSPVASAAYRITTDTDGNGLPDPWEIQYFGHIGNDPNSSPDGNGFTLLQDYQGGADPTNYYSQPGSNGPILITPTLTVVSGNLQSSPPSSFTTLPLLVQVTDSSGAALVNAPVAFSVTSGGGLVAGTSGGTTTSTLVATTDANGQAQVYYQSANSASSTINATTGGQSVTFTELSGSVTTPVFSPPAGTYPSTQTVTLTAANQQPINVALAANGSTATASSTQPGAFPASSVINGDRLGINWSGGGGWMDGTGDDYPDWLEVDFEGSQPISQIDLFTLQDQFQNPSDPTLDLIFSHYGVTDFKMQYWNGSAWADVPNGTISNNNHVWNQFNFSAITTAKIRVLISGAAGNYSRLTELEAWVRPSPAATIYYTMDGTTPTASSASMTSGGSISVAATEIVKAFTVAAGYSDSPVASAAYRITADSDGNGLPDPWELQYFGHIGNDPNSSPDGNGFTLLQDYQGGANPTNYYSQPGSNGPILITPTLTVVSGNLQSSPPSSFTALPLLVQVTDSNGAALVNAPVTFTVSSGGGFVAGTSGGTTTSTLLATTDANGHAQVYYQSPSGNSVSSTINATTGGQSVTFTELSGSITTPVFSPPAGTYPSTQTVTLTAANQQPINVALASNGATALASSTQAIGFPASSVINGDRLGMNWSGGGGWMDGTGDTYPDWLEVDFEGSQPISQIDLFTLQDLFQNPSDPTLDMIFSHYGVTDFEMQYWNGSAWVDVPNGQIAGNNHVWNQFNFSPITTPKIRILITGADGDYSRLTELEAWVRPSPAATIYYTTDGTTPTASSTSVTSGGSISVANTETVKAYTVAAGYSDSPVSSAAYTITSATDTDGNGLPDAWEIEYFGHIGNDPNSLDPSGDGLTLLQAYQRGINPLAPPNSNALPTLQIVGGNNQVGPAGSVLSSPLVVRVINQQGQVLSNALIQFVPTAGAGQISATSGGALFGSLSVHTNSVGLAQVYLAPGGGTGTVNRVTATATNGGRHVSVVFTATIGTTPNNINPTPGGSGTGPVADTDPTSLPAPYVTLTASEYNYVTLSWSAVSNAASYEVDQIDDLGTHIVYTGSATSFTITGLYSGVGYQFQVYAVNGAVRSRAGTPPINYQTVLPGNLYYVSVVAAIQLEWQPIAYTLTPHNVIVTDLTPIWGGDKPYTVGENYKLIDIAQNGTPPPSIPPDDDEFIIGYRFVFNPSRPNGTFTWWDLTGNSPGPYSSPTTGTISTSANYVGNSDTSPDEGLLVSNYGAQYGSIVHLLPSQSTNNFFYVDMVGSGNESATVSWTGSGSSHFTVNLNTFVSSSTGLKLTYIPITNGSSVSTSGPGFPTYTILPISGLAQSGDQITFTVADNLYGTKVFTYTYQTTTAPDYSMSVDEASGPKYRKIALNGMPMSDEKPQQTGETDQEQEESYIDALTVGLRHSTTDAYMPVSGSDMSVSARRDFRSEVWNTKSGLRPHEAPDKPFGLCWSSNLAPNIRFTSSNNPQKTQPDQAQVTDETGAVHSFFIWQSGGATNFFPMPTAKNEQQTPNLESLTLTTPSTTSAPAVYTFKKKYGGSLTFTMTPLTLATEENRIQGSTYSTTNTYARLTQAVDRLGNTINYTFTQPNDLVPTTITVANQPATTLSIQQQPVSTLLSGATSTQNLITAIWDAKGNKTTFNYGLATSGDTQAPCLNSVVTPDGATTRYTYDIASETDTMPQPATPTPPPYWHAELGSISDPLNHTYGFTYLVDHSKFEYMNNPSLFTGYYPKPGLPRNVHVVTLPSMATATFTNASAVGVSVTGGVASLINLDTSANPTSTPGTHQVNVTDATGFARSWRFGSPVIVPLPAFKSFYTSSSLSDSKIICYQSLNIDEGSSTSGNYLGTEAFQFDVNAGMALSQITDFSGNNTSFAHGDSWTDPTGLYRTIMTNSSVNSHYGDPTSQTDALGHTKTFSYYGGNRIMQTATDENGNQTYNDIDSLGRRTSEKIYDPTHTLVQETDFAYGNATYPGFMTSKAVKKLGGANDPSWATDLVTQYVPDSNGRVAQEIVDPAGLALVTKYSYDANGNKVSSTDPKGNTTWFSYDTRNRLVTVSYADGGQKQMVYDSRGNKTAEYDENGIATLYQYDEFNRLQIQARDMNGNGIIDAGTDLLTTYAYNDVNSKTSVTDPKGHTTHMYYDAMQRVSKITDALSQDTLLDYGANSGGNAFDSSGFKPTHTVDPRGVTTDVTYDVLYRATDKYVKFDSSLAPSHTHTDYDFVGNPQSVTDPVGNITTTDFDALNRPKQVHYADTSTAKMTYTSTGLKGSTVDEDFHETQTQYDGAGRPVQVTAGIVSGSITPACPVVHTYYDPAGNVSETVNPRGYATDYVYDARNRKLQEFEPSVVDATTGTTSRPSMQWQYDAAGNVTGAIDARNNETDTVYDAANRVTDVNQPAVTSGGTSSQPNIHSTYDLAGNVHTVRDPNGHTTVNEYDELNRLYTSTDAAGNVVTNGYDQVGNKTSVQDGNLHTTTFHYDGLNRNTDVIDPESKTTHFTYDGLNKTQRLDANGQTTIYTYDQRNRLQTVAYTGRSADNRVYGYDNVGNLQTVTQSGLTAANVGYTYDALNRAITETSQGKTHGYAYDVAGNRLQTVYGGTGRTITSTYDALNRLSTMQDQTAAEITASSPGRTSSYGYDLNGNVVQKSLPNGDSETTSFDMLNRATIESAQTGGASALFTYTYGYDLGGNVTTVAETYSSGLNNRTVTNTYDNINRLHIEDVAASVNVTTTYEYDAANNRTSKAIVGGPEAGTTNYSYNDLNQLTGYGDGTRSVALTYDLDGNRATRVVTGGSDNGTDTYSYDDENRLIGLVKGTTGSAGTYAYQYDYRTRRITRDESAASGTKTAIVFSGGTSVQEYDTGGTGSALSVEYIRGSDYGGGVGGILYTIRGGTPSYTHANKRGDVVAKTDASGALTYQAQYEAFGKQVATTGSTLDRQKSNSKDTDPTGLVDEGMRYRDLDTGMFITRDPAGFVDGPNLYTYVVQNPWTKFDPEGLFDVGPTTAPAVPSVAPVAAAAAAGAPAEVPVAVAVGAPVAAAATGVALGGAIVTEVVVHENVMMQGGYAQIMANSNNQPAALPPSQNPSGTSQKDTKAQTQAATSGDNSSGGNKPPTKTAAAAAAPEPHKNSKDSMATNHRYEIDDSETGKLHKTGVSAEELNEDGSSPRANRQVNQLNKAAGYPRYSARVAETDIQGRQAALDNEQARVDQYARENNGVGPKGNQKPKPTSQGGEE